MPASVGPVALADVACSALETLLALMRHQRICRQCRTDERFCQTAITYQSAFMADVHKYDRYRNAR